MIPVTLEGLTKRFGSTIALDQIDFRIEAGEIFFLLGPSGCGKTTLLRTIAGFYEPDAGRVLFGNDDVTRLPPHARNTGMMFQSYALWPHMTVAQNVAFGLEERKVPKEETTRRVAEALESVKMGEYGERRIHQLSGGQQQRVALARAMVIRPRCLLLDEPLSNLDAKLRLEMRAEIRRVCREAGLTAIYVTHDQKEALSIADRMAVLDGGRIQQLGTPAELYRHPQSQFVAEFMGETNMLPGTLVSVGPTAAEVDTVLGRFATAAPKDVLKPGAAVRLSIRPESWRLATENGAVNSVPGRLKERVYLGEMAQYRLAPTRSGETELKVLEINPRFVDSSGDRELYATVSPEDVVVLAR
jgi:iron(III) transport system ATP-binding protein